jgi:hypothetical protein
MVRERAGGSDSVQVDARRGCSHAYTGMALERQKLSKHVGAHHRKSSNKISTFNALTLMQLTHRLPILTTII